MNTLYLASGSPRRRELLQQIGVPFSPLAVSIDESPLPGELPTAYVERLARSKAAAGLNMLEGRHGAVVLGADTAVVLDGRILGKPLDEADAREMLTALSGRTHQVLTAVALVSSRQTLSRVVSSDVCFRTLGADEITTYWMTGEPCDKAGGYGIQGLAAVFVQSLSGSYSAVVGLPLSETAELLRAFDIAYWQFSG